MENPTETTDSQPLHGSESVDPDRSPAETEPVSVRCSLCGNVIEAMVQAETPVTVTCSACGLGVVLPLPNKPCDAVPNDPEPDTDESQETDELDRWLSGDPIKAEPLNDWQQFRRWAAKRPRLAGLISCLAVVVTLTALFSTIHCGHTMARLSRTDRQLRETLNRFHDAKAVAVENVRVALARQREAQTEKSARHTAELRLREAEDSREQAEERLAQGEIAAGGNSPPGPAPGSPRTGQGIPATPFHAANPKRFPGKSGDAYHGCGG